MQAQLWIVDDEQDVRESLAWLLTSLGWSTRSWSSALCFLDDLAEAPLLQPTCLLADVRMPEMTGLELLNELQKRGMHLPVILMTGHGDVPMAVRALKEGALDFFEKPYNDQLLLESINRALEIHRQQLNTEKKQAQLELNLSYLTPREHQVLALLLEGLPGKQIAAYLKISPKTVDVHRHRVMHKLKVSSLADLIRRYDSLAQSN